MQSSWSKKQEKIFDKYLDTNISIYAIENHPKYGESCKRILQDVESAKLKVCSSMLVLVELLSVLKKINEILENRRRETLDIRKNIDAVLSLPIVWFDLNFLIIKRASEYEFNVSGVDYIHVASMELN